MHRELPGERIWCFLLKIFQDSFIHHTIIANLDTDLLLPLYLNQTQTEDLKEVPDFFVDKIIWYREHYWDLTQESSDWPI